MAEILQPSVEIPWASGVSSAPDVEEPSDQLKASGWPRTGLPTPRKTWNWILKRADQGVAHYLQHGVPSYDAAQEYHAGAVVRSGVDGHVYIARATYNAGTGDPATSGGTVWQRIDCDPWEWPGYSDLLTGFLVDDGGDNNSSPPSHSDAFEFPELGGLVFTKGFGLALSSAGTPGNLSVSIGAGMCGIGIGTSMPITSPVVRWTMAVDSSVTLSAPSVGTERWDAIVATPVAQTANGSNGVAFSVVAGSVLTTGSDDYSFPFHTASLGEGSLVGYAHIKNAAGVVTIDKVADCVIPIGTPCSVFARASASCWGYSSNYYEVSLTNGAVVDLFSPPEFVGGNARLLGFSFSHKLPAGTTVEVGRMLMGESYVFTPLMDISDRFTFGNTYQTRFVSTSGPPFNLSGSANTFGPLWSHGYTNRPLSMRASVNSQVGIRVTSGDPGAGSSLIYSITWYFLKV